MEVFLFGQRLKTSDGPRDNIHLFFSVPSIDHRHHFTFNDIDQISMINKINKKIEKYEGFFM